MHYIFLIKKKLNVGLEKSNGNFLLDAPKKHGNLHLHFIVLSILNSVSVLGDIGSDVPIHGCVSICSLTVHAVGGVGYHGAWALLGRE